MITSNTPTNNFYSNFAHKIFKYYNIFLEQCVTKPPNFPWARTEAMIGVQAGEHTEVVSSIQIFSGAQRGASSKSV